MHSKPHQSWAINSPFPAQFSQDSKTSHGSWTWSQLPSPPLSPCPNGWENILECPHWRLDGFLTPLLIPDFTSSILSLPLTVSMNQVELLPPPLQPLTSKSLLLGSISSMTSRYSIPYLPPSKLNNFLTAPLPAPPYPTTNTNTATTTTATTATTTPIPSTTSTITTSFFVETIEGIPKAKVLDVEIEDFEKGQFILPHHSL